MSNKKIIIWLVVAVALLGIAVYFLPNKVKDEGINTNINTNTSANANAEADVSADLKHFSSADLGLSFDYPAKYFLEVKKVAAVNSSVKGGPYTLLILTEDTVENQEVREGSAPAREGPVSVSLAVYPSDLDGWYSPQQWIQDNSNSNFKLSDGSLTPVNVAGQTGFSYRWSGLYEADNLVVAAGSFIYSFVVTYITPNDSIRSDFAEIVESVTFL